MARSGNRLTEPETRASSREQANAVPTSEPREERWALAALYTPAKPAPARQYTCDYQDGMELPTTKIACPKERTPRLSSEARVAEMDSASRTVTSDSLVRARRQAFVGRLPANLTRPDLSRFPTAAAACHQLLPILTSVDTTWTGCRDGFLGPRRCCLKPASPLEGPGELPNDASLGTCRVLWRESKTVACSVWPAV